MFTPEQQIAYRTYQKRQKEKYLVERYQYLLSEGRPEHFIFMAVNRKYDISPETLARLVYLSTFLKYNHNGVLAYKRKPIKQKDLPAILGVSTDTVKKFLSESQEYLTVLDDKTIQLNNRCFIRGSLSKANNTYIKIYIHAMRKLYEQTKTTHHRYLGYIFKVLPYINIKYNILCWNPGETDLEEIDPITHTQFCKLIGYSETHSSILQKAYSKISFKCESDDESISVESDFCKFISNRSTLHTNGSRIYVNPFVMYRYSSNNIRILHRSRNNAARLFYNN